MTSDGACSQNDLPWSRSWGPGPALIVALGALVIAALCVLVAEEPDPGRTGAFQSLVGGFGWADSYGDASEFDPVGAGSQ